MTFGWYLVRVAWLERITNSWVGVGNGEGASVLKSQENSFIKDESEIGKFLFYVVAKVFTP